MSHLVLFIAAVLAASHVYAAILPQLNHQNTLENEIITGNNEVARKYQKKSSLKSFKISTRPPETAHHYPGGKVELQCNVFSFPMPTIQWLKNDVPIKESDYESNNELQSTSQGYAHIYSTLIIDQLSENTQDVYTCLATNAVRTDSASTTVFTHNSQVSLNELAEVNNEIMSTPSRPRITKYIRAILADKGENIVLTCGVKGHPRPEFYWADSNGMPVEDDHPRAKVLPSGDLFLSNLSWEDMGRWVCNVKNRFGRDSIRTFVYPATMSYGPREVMNPSAKIYENIGHCRQCYVGLRNLFSLRLKDPGLKEVGGEGNTDAGSTKMS